MEKQKIAILGSTGSIGTQTLEIIRQHPSKFELIALSANSNYSLLADQIEEFEPRFGLICDESKYQDLKLNVSNSTTLLAGYSELETICKIDDLEVVLNSLVGFAGFYPTYHALKAGKRVALANKESLVVGGKLITNLIQDGKHSLIPVDSEHSAMLQCLVGEDHSNIEKIVITASGGPFRSFSRKQMESITVDQALKHPNWEMGAKITIDSSTMMNKGLEIIEAHWLFDLPVSQIEPVIHPQSIIHSIVTFKDGSSKAQLGPPDMKVPIIYALSFPDRFELDTPRMDWTVTHNLEFQPVDYQQFPCVRLAMDSLEGNPLDPAILNAANEIAVKRFLNKEISYISIPKIIETSLEKLTSNSEISVNNLIAINQETREFASQLN